MKAIRVRTAIFAFLAFSAVLLTSLPAFGHDPLKDLHAHSDHHNTHRAGGRVNLGDVRAKIVAFRETGDDRNLDDAWQMLTLALRAGRANAETLIVASFVEQSRHKFSHAIKLIEQSLSINKNNDEAWLLLASIQLVLGDANAAAQACGQLRASPPLVLLTCKARVALATGDHELALHRLQEILAVVDEDRLPAETLAWSYSVTGDLAVAAGESQKAILLFQQSLTFAERTQVRSALVDVFLTTSNYDAASRTLADGSLALPLLVRRLIVAKHLGRLRELQPMLARVQQEFDAWIADEDWLHAREMARFYLDVLDEPARARRLALINLSLQQEPEDQRLEKRTRLAG